MKALKYIGLIAIVCVVAFVVWFYLAICGGHHNPIC